jgi:glycosyltransferase involved in cell wall biosynthesis
MKVMMDELRMFKFLRKVMNRLDIAYVATFPPRECGIATFTQDLLESIGRYTPFSDPTVVAINDNSAIYKYSKLVKHQIAQNDLSSYYEAADYLNESSVDIVSIQHEFGIYGGQSGDYLIPFLSRLKKPVVATLHTVLPQPDAHQKQIIEELFRRAKAVITMIDTGRQILSESYNIDSRKIVVIPHGVPNVPKLPVDRVKKVLGIEDRQVLSTFGLINRGKGLEYVKKIFAVRNRGVLDSGRIQHGRRG